MIRVVCIGYLAWLIHWYQLAIAYERLQGGGWFLAITVCYGLMTFLHVSLNRSPFNAFAFIVYAIGQCAFLHTGVLFLFCGVPLQSLHLALPMGLAAACFIADVAIQSNK